MEPKIFRLTIALSILAFVGFGIPAVDAINSRIEYHELVLRALEDQREHRDDCRSNPRSNCDSEMYRVHESIVNRFVKYRNEAHEREEFFVTAAIGIPAGLFLLFFGGRWVLTGSLRKPPRQHVVRTAGR